MVPSTLNINCSQVQAEGESWKEEKFSFKELLNTSISFLQLLWNR